MKSSVSQSDRLFNDDLLFEQKVSNKRKTGIFVEDANNLSAKEVEYKLFNLNNNKQKMVLLLFFFNNSGLV